jgi:hypothetical protein
MRVLVSICVLVCTLLTAQAEELYQQKVCTRIAGIGYRGAITCFTGKLEWEWIPSKQQIVDLERRLPMFISSSKSIRKTKIPSNLSRYIRYYSGVLRGGRRDIDVKFIFDSVEQVRNRSWLTEPFFALGGGDDYFQVSYDSDQSKFIELVVNADE